MNLLNAPREAIEQIRNHPAARHLGSVENWLEEQFYAVLAHAYDLPFRRITMAEIDANAFHRHQAFFIRNGQIPIKHLPDMLVVTECEPWDKKRLQDLLQEFELGIKRVLITQRNYDELLGGLSRYKPESPRIVEPAETPVFFPNAAWENADVFHEIVRRADLMRASDIHLEPSEGYLRIRFRVHGNLLVQRRLTLREGEEVIKSLKLEARLLASSVGTFQSSRVRLSLPHCKTLDLRVEVFPTVDGESVVMRLLDFKSIDRTLEQLNLPAEYHSQLLDSISKTSGLVIVTGPTGSGKTTTLYTVLQHLNSKDSKIITIEDPVEYRIRGFSQIQIEPDKGITFPNSIRSALRSDPDVMLVGEVRDEETAKLAVAAAETGHLVFTTLHTNNAIETLSRLDRLGVDRYQLQTLIRLVIAQRLVGVLCPSCKTGREAKEHERQLLNQFNIPCQPGHIVYEKRGCTRCNGVGTIGRAAVYSFFSPSEAVRELMGTDCPILDIIRKAKEGGFKTVLEHALKLWLDGTASFSEVHALAD
ncbi:MAG: Flp pilus assembly complex ATPase component TadA [Verrucomicrobia bacterium]|nr:Flp pilus assembly complex ATPase component TadA [Verrucomicrobiota bacterium]